MKITKKQLKQIIKEEMGLAGESGPPRELVRQWEKSITEFIDKQFQLGGDDIAGESPAIVAALENVRRNYSDNLRGDLREHEDEVEETREGLSKKQSAEEWEKMKDAGDPKRKGTTDVFSKKQLKQNMKQNKSRSGR